MINDDEKPIIEQLKIPSEIVDEFEALTSSTELSGLVLVNTYLAWKKSGITDSYKAVLKKAIDAWTDTSESFIIVFTSILSAT